MRWMALLLALAVALALPSALGAEDDRRTQYPFGLSNSFFDFNVGYIDNHFSGSALEPGYQVRSVRISPMGARLGFGHRFTEHLSAQIVYARPLRWVRYEDVSDSSGELSSHSVLTNLAGLTVRSTVPLVGSFSLYTEGGLGIMTRSGFKVDVDVAVREANYATYLLGAGFTYRLNNAWDLRAGADYTPAKACIRQPRTLVFSTGAVLNLRERPSYRVAADAGSGAVFPRHLVQIGHSTNELGTGVNSLFSSKIPIFWGGSARVMRGLHLRYQRNVYHTARMFSLDTGASIGNWWSEQEGQNFWTFSVYPQFKFTLVRTKPLDAYLYYSLAGPTYISRSPIDGKDTARKFTFQDLMGLGVYITERRAINFDVSIGHYSNGNLTAHNSGVKIPLTVSMGIAF